jgi:N6-adenosine-specific RNA methylase IME4
MMAQGNLFGLEYPCVAADPPWPFEDALPGCGRGAEKHYRLMTINEICGMTLLPPDQFPLLAADSVLFLWRVASMVEGAYRVCHAWGFVPKSEIIWLKRNDTGGRHMGMGHYVRAEHETCIIATRGSPTVLSHSIRSTFEAPVGEHSEKPQEFFDIVERLVPGPRVEMFARRRRPRWDAMGDQVPEAA